VHRLSRQVHRSNRSHSQGDKALLASQQRELADFFFVISAFALTPRLERPWHRQILGFGAAHLPFCITDVLRNVQSISAGYEGCPTHWDC
jgi:hypothetical protein